jgi:hypothetical protein
MQNVALERLVKVALAHHFDKLIAPMSDLARRKIGMGNVIHVLLKADIVRGEGIITHHKVTLEVVFDKPDAGGIGRRCVEYTVNYEDLGHEIIAPIVASLTAIPDCKLGAQVYVDFHHNPDFYFGDFYFQLSDDMLNFHYQRNYNLLVHRPNPEVTQH